MSLKESQTSINFQTVRTFTTLLTKNKKKVVRDTSIISALEPLIDIINQIEVSVWETRINRTSARLSEMLEEDRRISLMGAKEKNFFLAFKAQHPENKWDYYQEYLKIK
jgi:REP element-mobilizing transposase RayT